MFTKRTIITALSIFTLVAGLALAFPPAALAFEGRGGNEVIVPADETIDDDLYAGGDRVVIDGTVKGDLVAFAGEIIVNGTVEGDVLGAAKLIRINGTVGDDVRAAGYSIEFMPGAKVGSDLVGASYSLHMHKDSVVGRSLVFAGGQGVLAGEVGREVKFATEGVEISGVIGGDAELMLGSKENRDDFRLDRFSNEMPSVPVVEPGLKVASSAKIGGNLTYTSKDTGTLPEGVVAGETAHLLPKLETDRPDATVKATPATMAVAWALGSLRFFISLIIVGLLSVWLFPQWITRTADAMQAAPAQSLGWGVVTFIGFWFALMVAFSVVILAGIILGVLTLGELAVSVFLLGLSALGASVVFFMLAVSYFSMVVAGYWIGSEALRRFQPAYADKLVWSVLTGAVILGIVCAVPVLGWVLRLLGSVIGLGAIFLLVRGMLRKDRAAEISAVPTEPAA